MKYWRFPSSKKSNRDSIFNRMTLQIFPYDCSQDNASLFSELLLKEGAKDVKRIGHRGDGDNFILYFYLMSVQGTWMQKSSSKANYKMTGMSVLKIKLFRLCFYVRKIQKFKVKVAGIVNIILSNFLLFLFLLMLQHGLGFKTLLSIPIAEKFQKNEYQIEIPLYEETTLYSMPWISAFINCLW